MRTLTNENERYIMKLNDIVEFKKFLCILIEVCCFSQPNGQSDDVEKKSEDEVDGKEGMYIILYSLSQQPLAEHCQVTGNYQTVFPRNERFQ